MENLEETEQIEQEETLPLQPSSRKKYLLVGITITLILLVGGGIFLFQDSPKRVEQQVNTLRDATYRTTSEASYEGNIQFTVLSQRLDDKEEILIGIQTTEEFGCINYDLLVDFEKVGQVLTFVIGGTQIDGDICFTAIGPASYQKLLALEIGNYKLRFVSGSKFDLYDMRISAEEITITPQIGFFSSTETTKINLYPSLPNNFTTVRCFRYEYGCEDKNDVVNELCSLVSEKILETAREVSLEEVFGKKITEDVEMDDEHKFYLYEGSADDLREFYESTKFYTLPHGRIAECRGKDVYYLSIRSELFPQDEELCCGD